MRDRARWIEVTVIAQERWEEALARYHTAPLYPLANDQRERDAAGMDALERARREYRSDVLAAFWKLMAPLQPGEMVPLAVAELEAERWDISTRPGAHWSDR